jgi:hypothetical protein
LDIQPAKATAHGDLVLGHILYNEFDKGGYPASEALPLISSLGMMISPRIVIVAISSG